MTQLLVIGFSKAIRGKGLSKNKPTVKTPLHRHSMEVRRSGLWAPDWCGRTQIYYRYWGLIEAWPQLLKS